MENHGATADSGLPAQWPIVCMCVSEFYNCTFNTLYNKNTDHLVYYHMYVFSDTPDSQLARQLVCCS